METKSLRLLPPQQLPTQLTLSAEQLTVFLAVLRLLLEATNHSNADLAIKKLNQAFSLLEDTQRSPMPDTPTKTLLSRGDIEDYDQYFGVSHSEAENVAVGLLSSVIVALREMVLLSKSHEFNPNLLATLKQGYSSYLGLILQVFS